MIKSCNSSEKNWLTYRPDIDGIRALAIISIVIFHLNNTWLPGGFLGVDIFFVISGFLITSIIYKDHCSDRFYFLNFYQRRIARIAPASLIASISTIFTATLIFSSLDLASAGAGLISASLFLANIKYMIQGNYFQMSADAQPYLHYWSLSLEEQFYLFMPVILVFLLRRLKKYTLVWLLVLWIFSFIGYIIINQFNPIWAFYLLPTRAWELLTGSIIAVYAINYKYDVNSKYLKVIRLTSTAIVVGSLAFFNEDILQGWILILPIVATGILLIPQSNKLNSGNITYATLTYPAITMIGRSSYSLYLWHWPIFCFIDYHYIFESSLFRFALKIALCGLITYLSYCLIEKPARKFFIKEKHRFLTYTLFLSLVIASVTLGYTIRQSNHINASISDIKNGGIVLSTKENNFTLALLGDSNASMYGTMIRGLCKSLNLNLIVLSSDGGNPFPNVQNTTSQWTLYLDAIRKNKPNFIIISSQWTQKIHGNETNLIKTLRTLEPLVNHIILINQPPILPSQASRSGIRSGNMPPYFEYEEDSNRRAAVNNFLATLRSEKISVIDTDPLFLKQGGEIIIFNERREWLYQDSSHLSRSGSQLIKNKLEDTLKELILSHKISK